MRLADPRLLCTKAYVDGGWVAAGNGAVFEVCDPATGALIAEVPDMDAGDTAAAIAAAAAALPAWRAKSAKARAIVLRAWFDLIMANQEDLGQLLTWEQGKPIAEARGEIAYAASFVEWFAEEGKRVYGDVMAHPDPANRIVVLKQPIGVCAAITPWNFPAAMITRKAAPALAAGCTMVIKPAEQTPLTALALCELADRAGIPKGVINVVTCSAGMAPAVGKALTGSPEVRKLSFTGSTEIGRLLMRDCAATIKKVALELGGNSPFIVFGDADLDAAADGLMASKFRNTGQTCVCANRVLVQASVHDAFTAKLMERVAALQVGAGNAAGMTQGPLIDAPALAKVEEHIADAIAKGATVLMGGKRHALGGNFFEPTILDGATRAMLVSQEETFGPVAALYRFDTEAEAIAMANDSEFGLASYFYSRDIGRVWRVSEALEAGIVGVNAGIISNEVAPFGGVKQSGIGREGSRYGLEEFLEIKYLCMGGIG